MHASVGFRLAALSLIALVALFIAPALAAAEAGPPAPYDVSGCFPGEVATLCVEDHGVLKLTTTPNGTLVSVATGTVCVDVFVGGDLVRSFCEDYRNVTVVKDFNADQQVLRFRRAGTQVDYDPGTGEPAVTCAYSAHVVFVGGEDRHEDIESECTPA